MTKLEKIANFFLAKIKNFRKLGSSELKHIMQLGVRWAAREAWKGVLTAGHTCIALSGQCPPPRLPRWKFSFSILPVELITCNSIISFTCYVCCFYVQRAFSLLLYNSITSSPFVLFFFKVFNFWWIWPILYCLIWSILFIWV